MDVAIHYTCLSPGLPRPSGRKRKYYADRGQLLTLLPATYFHLDIFRAWLYQPSLAGEAACLLVAPCRPAQPCSQPRAPGSEGGKRQTTVKTALQLLIHRLPLQPFVSVDDAACPGLYVAG